MTPPTEDLPLNGQSSHMSLLKLPYTVLCNIFIHVQDNPAAFSLTCRLFHDLSLETVNIVEYFCQKYGQALALFLAILRHPRRLTESVTRALLKRHKVLMPRNLAQRLLQVLVIFC
jgi:hypothetical protein